MKLVLTGIGFFCVWSNVQFGVDPTCRHRHDCRKLYAIPIRLKAETPNDYVAPLNVSIPLNVSTPLNVSR